MRHEIISKHECHHDIIIDRRNDFWCYMCRRRHRHRRHRPSIRYIRRSANIRRNTICFGFTHNRLERTRKFRNIQVIMIVTGKRAIQRLNKLRCVAIQINVLGDVKMIQTKHNQICI